MNTAERRVVANLAVTMDGYYAVQQDAQDPLAPYISDAEVGYGVILRTIATATTALFGRVNAEIFLKYWPSVIGTGEVDPRDEEYAKWLVGAEKVVLSRTLTESPWPDARILNAPAAEVIADLKTEAGGDIFVQYSGSVINQLLAADVIDRLNLIVAPAVGGSGSRLFTEGLPHTDWELTHHDASGQGVLGLTYDRKR